MKKTYRKESLIRQDALTDRICDRNTVFFDIETTGFSPKSASVYMIGCACRLEDGIRIDQFFAENPSEEPAVLSAFLELLKNYGAIITYNGAGFDIPFLEAKCDHYGLQGPFKDLRHLDLYRSISRFKFLLGLPDCRQKTIERFLNLFREDRATGGELINVYHDYAAHPTEESCRLLHLHNGEDVIGMTGLLPMLAYQEILNGAYTVCSARVERCRRYDKTTGEDLIITLQNDCPAPRRVSCRAGDFHIMIDGARTAISVPVFHGELRFYFPNYRDYYYLPAEDMAVHKSVSGFVDRTCRETARASNCYQRRVSSYLPQYKAVMQPLFYRKYKDTQTWFELTEDFCSSGEMLRRYAEHIFEYMLETRS